MKLGDLKLHPRNPRKISPAKVQALKDALNEFGDLGAIVFNRRTGVVLGGNQRTKALPPEAAIVIERRFEQPTRTGTVAEGYVELDGEHYKFREVDWDEDREKMAMIAANKHGGDWDLPMLSEIMLELEHANLDMSFTGFDNDEMVKLFAPVGNVEHHNDRSLENLEEQWNQSEIRQVVLVFDPQSFEEVINIIDAIKRDQNLNTTTDAVTFTLRQYAENRPKG